MKKVIKISIFLLKIVLFLIESYAALIGGGIILDCINSFPGEMPRDLEITLKTILRFIEPEDMIDHSRSGRFRRAHSYIPRSGVLWCYYIWSS